MTNQDAEPTTGLFLVEYAVRLLGDRDWEDLRASVANRIRWIDYTDTRIDSEDVLQSALSKVLDGSVGGGWLLLGTIDLTSVMREMHLLLLRACVREYSNMVKRASFARERPWSDDIHSVPGQGPVDSEELYQLFRAAVERACDRVGLDDEASKMLAYQAGTGEVNRRTVAEHLAAVSGRPVRVNDVTNARRRVKNVEDELREALSVELGTLGAD
ncbi:hypothetical protein [Rubrivirga sp.]|uniref:hypothetical protein n=1 Tax=Rubrivirga sp. TaxID=1885344 RepID=UPI003B518745